MEWIRLKTQIDFMGKKEWCIAVSALLILAGLVSMVLKGGPRYGIDFVGGTLVQVRLQKAVPLGDLRAGLKGLGLGDSLIQQFGEPEEILIRFSSTLDSIEDPGKRILTALEKVLSPGQVELRRVETVGPQISQDLRSKAILAVLVSFVAMFFYISYRFGVKWAAGGILAVIHDALFTLGVFSLLDKEITLPVVAALLTIIGYSINDTIVVFDRIRENRKKQPKEELTRGINRSINETLSRTILTSFTVFLVVVTLFLWGGEVIRDFAFALIVGVLVGTYSSIFIASPVLVFWERPANRGIPAKVVQKEGR